ncbi:hypothetical protein [Ruegeria profundi]|uniref:hypothetical protein n=1 Tax=Ruegeria profundi TaxID=1685378 RepID=UPI001CD3CDEE|nr:hypothetical protein [Ruegeria profundi]MCA0927293.1 hypothetical protein [Ruegeria profundi]
MQLLLITAPLAPYADTTRDICPVVSGVINIVLGLALLSAIYILPMIFITIWPATKLSPARSVWRSADRNRRRVRDFAGLKGKPGVYRQGL